MAGLKDELMTHFTDVVLVTANRLQSWSSSNPSNSTEMDSNPCNEFAKQLLACIECMPVPQVIVYT